MPRDIRLENPAEWFGPATATAAVGPVTDARLANPAEWFGAPSGGDAAAAMPTRLTPTGTLRDVGRVLGELPGAIADAPRLAGQAIGQGLRRMTGKDQPATASGMGSAAFDAATGRDAGVSGIGGPLGLPRLAPVDRPPGRDYTTGTGVQPLPAPTPEESRIIASEREAMALGPNPTQAILDGKSPRLNAIADQFTPGDVEAFRRQVGTPQARAMPEDRLRRFMAMELDGSGAIASGAGAPPADPRGIIARNVADFGQGVVNAGIRQPAAAISSTIGHLAASVGSPETAETFFDNAREVASRNPAGDSVGGFVGQTVGSIAPSAMALALGPAGPALVASYYGVQGFGTGVQIAREAAVARGEPYNPAEGAMVGMGYAAVEAITEKLGFEYLTSKLPNLDFAFKAFKTNPTAAGAKGILEEAYKLGLAGALEEGSAQIGQNAVQRGADGRTGFFEGVPGAAAGGALGNWLLGGGQIAQSGAAARLEAAMRADAQTVRPPQTPSQTAPEAPGAPQSDSAPGDAQASTQGDSVAPGNAAGVGVDDANLPQWARDARRRMMERRAESQTGTDIPETPASIPETPTPIPDTPGAIPETPGGIPETNAADARAGFDNPNALAESLIGQMDLTPAQRLLAPLGIVESAREGADINSLAVVGQDAKLLGPRPVVFDSREQERAWTDAKQLAERRELIRIAKGTQRSEAPQGETPAIDESAPVVDQAPSQVDEVPTATPAAENPKGLKRVPTEAEAAQRAEAIGPKPIRRDEDGIVRVDPASFGDGTQLSRIRDRVREWTRTNLRGVKVRNQETGREITFATTGVKHSLKMNRNPDALRAMQALPDLLADAKLVETRPPKAPESEPSLIAVRRFENQVRVGDNEYTISMIVKESEERQRRTLELVRVDNFYHHSLKEVEGSAARRGSGLPPSRNAETGSGEPRASEPSTTSKPARTGSQPESASLSDGGASSDTSIGEDVPAIKQNPRDSSPSPTPNPTQTTQDAPPRETSTQAKVRAELAGKTVLQLRQEAKKQGLYSGGDAKALIERIVANTPEPKAAAGAYSKADVERRLVDAIDRTGYPVEDVDTEYFRQEMLGEPEFTTRFAGPMPGEVKRYLDGRGIAHRKWFTFNQPRGTGEDAMASLGEDRYFELVDQLISRSRNYDKAAKELAGADPDVGFLSWLKDQLPAEQSSRGAYDVVRTESIAPGSTMTIAGTRFDAMADPATGDIELVERNDDGSEITDRDPVMVYAAATAEVPIDAKSMKTPASKSRKAKGGAAALFDSIQEGAKQIADDAAARQQAREDRRNRDGKRLFSTGIPDIRDLADTVLFISGRAVEMGIKGTRESAKALSRLVESSLREVAPEHLPHAKDIRNQVARILRHKDATPENFDRLIAEIQEPLRAGKPAKKVAKEKAAAPAKAAKGLTKKPAEAPTITQSDALKTRLKAEEKVAGKVAAAAEKEQSKAYKQFMRGIVAAYKRGGADYARAAEPVMEGLRAQIKAMPGKIEAAMDLARRGGQDEAKAAQAIKDGIRDQMLELAKPYPAKVRGALTAAIAKADTPTKMVRILDKLDRRGYRARISDAAKRLVRATGTKKVEGIKGVTEDLRTKAQAARDLARKYHEESRMKEIRTGRLKVLAEELDAKAAELAFDIKVARNQYADIKGMRGMNAAAVSHTTVRTLETAKKEIKTEPGTDPERSKFTRARQNLWNIPRMLAAIEGKKGVLHELIYERGSAAERETNRVRMAMYAEADQIAKAAGFKDLEDAETAFDRASGKGVTRMIRVQIDGQMVPMTLGEGLVLYGYATDPDAAVGFVDQTQGVKHVDGRSGKPLMPSMNDMIALRLALEAEQPGITTWIDGVRALNAKHWPKVKGVVYRLTGTEPVTPLNRFAKIDRIIEPSVKDGKAQDAAASSVLPGGGGGGSGGVFSNGVLEAAKTYITRVNNRNPILLRNPATKLREEMEQSAKMIGMAEWARDVLNVLADDTLITTAAKRVRPGMIDLLRDQIASTYMDAPTPAGTARIGARIRSNLTTTFLGLNPKSYVVNALGFTRMLPDVRPQDWAGSAAMTATQMRSLFKDIQRRNPFFWDRYSRPAAERIGGGNTSSPDRPPMGLVRMLVRAAKNSKKADFAAAFGNTREAVHSVMKLYNAAEAPAVVQGYAAKIRESKAIHKGWAEDQHRDWAAIEAEMMVRATMPSNSNLDTSIAPTAMRNTDAAAWFTFTSDFLRARNRISQALRQDKGYAAKVIAAEALQIVFGKWARRVAWYPFALGIAAAYGLDDEDLERLNRELWDWSAIGQESLGEALDLIVPGLGRGVRAIQSAARGFGMSGSLAPPTTSEMLKLVEGFGEVSSAAVRAWNGDEKALRKFLDRLYESALDTSSVGLGNPLMPYIRAVNREARRQDQPEAVNLLDEDAKALREDAARLEKRLDVLNAAAAKSNNYKARDAFLNANRDRMILANTIERERRLIRADLKAAANATDKAERARRWKAAEDQARTARAKIKESTKARQSR